MSSALLEMRGVGKSFPGVKALQDEDLIVATVKDIVEEAPAEVVEGAAEPEVIGRKPEEGEEGAAPAPTEEAK